MEIARVSVCPFFFLIFPVGGEKPRNSLINRLLTHSPEEGIYFTYFLLAEKNCQDNNCRIRNYSGQRNCLMKRKFLGIPCNITASTIYLKSSNTIVMYNLRHLLFQNNDPLKYFLFFGIDSGFRVMRILFSNFRHEEW